MTWSLYLGWIFENGLFLVERKAGNIFLFLKKIGNRLPFRDERGVALKKWLMNWWLLKRAFPFKSFIASALFLAVLSKPFPKSLGAAFLKFSSSLAKS